MRIYSTRALPSERWQELDDVALGPLPPAEALAGVEALVVANEPVDPDVLDLFPSLRLVANFGVGYDRIDVAACSARGVAVTNTPGVLDAATADLAFALLLAVQRRVVRGDALIREGGWASAWPDATDLAAEVTGSTLGIVGLGRIGSAVARRALGFDMRVLYTSRRPGTSTLGEWCELDDLLARSDVVTLHVPLSSETRDLIDARRLALMRDGGTLVNTARAEVVDQESLLGELRSGRLNAALDVFPHEPSVPNGLIDLPNVVLTPHLGSATRRTRAAMADLVIDNVHALADGRPLLTPI